MAKPKPAPETHAPPDLVLPDLVLVKKPPQPEPKKAAAPAREAAAPPATKSHARRNLHPARVWPD